MEQLFEIQDLLIKEQQNSPYYQRQCFDNITFDNRITGLIGQRGIGKTTYLLHLTSLKGSAERKSLYITADNYYLIDKPLLELADKLYKETDVRMLCIDEIHKYENWNQELKNIADTYREMRVLFTGSSMIDIIRAKYDLSRRVTIHHLNGLSFREYLEINLNIKLPIITLDDILKNHSQIANDINIPMIIKHFHDYLRIGYYPFFTELTMDQEKFQSIENSVQKVIYEDIATLHSLKTPTLMLMEKLYKYIAVSLPGELSAYKLANTLGKDYESISEYLQILNQAGLIRFLYTNQAGKAMLRNPTKMYPDNTNMIYATQASQTEDAIKGKVRETFFLNHLQNAAIEVFYSQNGDFIVGGNIFEIGGKNKKQKQIKNEKNGYIVADGILTGFNNKIPLYLFGLLY